MTDPAPIHIWRYVPERQAILVTVGKNPGLREIPLTINQRAELLKALADDIANHIRSQR